MRRRRRDPLAFWLLIAAFLIANYVIVRLAPDSTGPAVSRAHPAVSATPSPGVSLTRGAALRELANAVLDAITTPAPAAAR